MTLLFVDGCDHYAVADVQKKWDGQYKTGSFGDLQLDATTKRTGRAALYISQYTTQGTVGVVRTIPASTTVIVGAAVRFSTLPGFQMNPFMRFLGVSEMLGIGITAANGLSVYNGGTTLGTTATSLFSLNVWYYLEARITFGNGTAGSFELRLDGATILNVSGVDTINSTDTSCTRVEFAARGASSTSGQCTYFLDDIYVCNNAGTINNTFLGDVRVDTLLPTGAGSQTEWTPSTGFNWAAVDDTTANTTDYVTSPFQNQTDLYATGDTAGTGQVYGVQESLYAQKTDAGVQKVSGVTRVGSTNYVATGQTLTLSTWTFRSFIWEQNPATSATWTASEINAAEFGMKSSND